mmetsp:Transcript_7609/g.15870  ORF Transcript_7609/g.15870 Transcript_7609/m.15870 type:complete len:244 (-) Transcript_7609:177-908(-)
MQGCQLLVVLEEIRLLLCELLRLEQLLDAEVLGLLQAGGGFPQAAHVDESARAVEAELIRGFQQRLLLARAAQSLPRLVARDAGGHSVDQQPDLLRVLTIQLLVHPRTFRIVAHPIAHLGLKTSAPWGVVCRIIRRFQSVEGLLEAVQAVQAVGALEGKCLDLVCELLANLKSIGPPGEAEQGEDAAPAHNRRVGLQLKRLAAVGKGLLKVFRVELTLDGGHGDLQQLRRIIVRHPHQELAAP